MLKLDTRQFVAAYSVGYVGVVSAIVGIYAWLNPGLLEGLSWSVWALLSTVFVYIIGLLLGILARRSTTEESEPADSSQSGQLYGAIPALFRKALDRADYREVIRFGDALSRPLFESGEFVVRLELGEITEEAAAHIGAVDVQYRTLIDSIGWSLIELGEFGDAAQKIQHGCDLAGEAGDAFYQAKAYRHLGAIERRRGRTEKSLEYYERARLASQQIDDDEKKSAMEAGITYAMAHLEYSRREFDTALATIDVAITLFNDLNDIYRVDMALVLKADIQVALKQFDRAKDTYRGVVQSSRMNRESVHYARAVLGLVELYIEDGQRLEAKRMLDRLDPDHVARMPAFADRFRSSRGALSEIASA